MTRLPPFVCPKCGARCDPRFDCPKCGYPGKRERDEPKPIVERLRQCSVCEAPPGFHIADCAAVRG